MSGLVVKQVLDQVKSLTRFNEKDVVEVLPERKFNVEVDLYLRQQATCTSKWSFGAGRLSFGAENVGESRFHEELNKRLEATRNLLPSEVRKWVGNSKGEYRRLLHIHHGVAEVGYEKSCGVCHGETKIQCNECRGLGEVQCHPCNGRGKVTCHQCRGLRIVRCDGYQCNGRGRWIDQVQEQVWNQSTGQFTTTYRSVENYCQKCNGSGNIGCSTCLALGEVSCNLCGSMGQHRCLCCSGSGRVNCADCAATGFKHEAGWVEVTISRDESLKVGVCDEVVERTIRTDIPLNRLLEYGVVTGSEVKFDGCSVYSKYSLSIEVHEAVFRVIGDEFKVFGFGAGCKVFDYKGVVSKLLIRDLERLESLVASTGFFNSLRGRGDLLEQLSLFVRSEVNMLVAEGSFGGDSAGVETAVAKSNSGLVSSEYVQRCSSALKSAFELLYSVKASRNFAFWLAVMFCSAISLPWLSGSSLGSGGLSVSLFLVGNVAWKLLEDSSLSRIESELPPKIGVRVVEKIRSSGVLIRWRWGLASLLALTLFLILVVIN